MAKIIPPVVTEVTPTLPNDSSTASNEGRPNKTASFSAAAVEDTADETKPTLETWNNPRNNRWKYLVSLYCLFMLGANDLR